MGRLDREEGRQVKQETGRAGLQKNGLIYFEYTYKDYQRQLYQEMLVKE